MLFRDRAGEWNEMFAVTLNTTSREEKEIAQLEHRLSFALVRIKSECALLLNYNCSYVRESSFNASSIKIAKVTGPMLVCMHHGTRVNSLRQGSTLHLLSDVLSSALFPLSVFLL